MMSKCKKCKGKGVIYSEPCKWLSIITLPEKIKCPKCQGRGKN